MSLWRVRRKALEKQIDGITDRGDSGTSWESHGGRSSIRSASESHQPDSSEDEMASCEIAPDRRLPDGWRADRCPHEFEKGKCWMCGQLEGSPFARARQSGANVSEETIAIEFGHFSLLPYRWIHDDQGRMGQQYLRIDYDRNGIEQSRKVLDPVAWITWK